MMIEEIEDLHIQIEMKRREMEQYIKNEGILSLRAIHKSQELDELIFQYQKRMVLIRQNSKK